MLKDVFKLQDGVEFFRLSLIFHYLGDILLTEYFGKNIRYSTLNLAGGKYYVYVWGECFLACEVNFRCQGDKMFRYFVLGCLSYNFGNLFRDLFD